jgi:DNA repair exonuclease SbcCD ATPase subunit
MMADIDKILEAERNIQDIANELKRMRDAANLLNNSQAEVQEIVKSVHEMMNSALTVVETTKDFSGKCGAIISALSSTDLSQIHSDLEKLESGFDKVTNHVQGNAQSLKADMQQQFVKANDEVVKRASTLQQALQEVSSVLKVQTGEVSSKLSSLIAKIEDSETHLKRIEEIARSSKKGTVFFLVILALLCIVTLGLVIRISPLH